MEKEQDQTSEGLNQIFEIINAKGDRGELEAIVDQKESANSNNENLKR